MNVTRQKSPTIVRVYHGTLRKTSASIVFNNSSGPTQFRHLGDLVQYAQACHIKDIDLLLIRLLGWKYSTPFPIAEQCIVPEDDTTRCWVGVATLLKKGIDLLFPSQSHTNEIVKNGEYVKWLQYLQPFLQDWEKNFDDAKCMFPMTSSGRRD